MFAKVDSGLALLIPLKAHGSMVTYGMYIRQDGHSRAVNTPARVTEEEHFIDVPQVGCVSRIVNSTGRFPVWRYHGSYRNLAVPQTSDCVGSGGGTGMERGSNPSWIAASPSLLATHR